MVCIGSLISLKCFVSVSALLYHYLQLVLQCSMLDISVWEWHRHLWRIYDFSTGDKCRRHEDRGAVVRSVSPPHRERDLGGDCRLCLGRHMAWVGIWGIHDFLAVYMYMSLKRYNGNKTSSSAVVERPRDALCPSVISLNKIIPQAESFITVTQASDLRLRDVVFGVTLRFFCHTLRRHFTVSRHQQTPPLTSD